MPKKNLEVLQSELKSELTKIINSKEYGDRKYKYGLTRKELIILQFLNALTPIKDRDGSFAASLSIEQVSFLTSVVENSLGDMQLNKKLKKITSNPKIRTLIYNDEDFDVLSSITKLINFTFKTRRIEDYDSIAKRFIENAETSSSHKISLAEYGILSDVHKILTKPPLPKHIYRNSVKLSRLFDMAEIVKPKIAGLQITFQQHILGSNILLMQDRKKLSIIRGVKMTLWQKLKYWVNNRMHASVVYRQNTDSPLLESHVLNEGVIKESFTFEHFMYSDAYKIKISSLISPENIEKLRQHYTRQGKDWEKEITKKYADIQRSIHDQTGGRLGRIKLADYEKIGAQSMFRHFKFKKTSFKAIRDRMLGEFYSGSSTEKGRVEMICSEFVARCTIASLVQLNDDLQDELSLTNGDIVDIPISKHEDIRYLTPERFVKLLKEKNCLEEVRIPKHLHGIRRDS